MSSGGIDPELAELIGISAGRDEEAPEFDALFDNEILSDSDRPSPDVDLTRTAFEPVTQFEEAPKPYFTDRNYYQKALSGEDESARKFHELLSGLLKSEDPEQRSHFRQKLIPVFWELAGSIATRVHMELPIEKMLLLRFGIVLPSLLSPEQLNMISRIIEDNATGEPLFYADEWLRAVGGGLVNLSSTDETKPAKEQVRSRTSNIVEKFRGKYDAQFVLLKARIAELESIENLLEDKRRAIIRHDTRPEYEGLKAPLDAGQKQALLDMSELLRKISAMDREISRLYTELDDARDQLEAAKRKANEVGEQVQVVDTKTVVQELGTLRQMAKLCVGKQGNHLPLLMKQYFRADIRDTGTRENVLKQLADVERLDPGLFYRTFKQQTLRIVPNVLILPCYGDKGVCWEPFDRFNRATSRGKIVIPLFPKELRSAIVAACGDLRWQVAKEKAQHYWMEEGLTGWYFQLFSERKMRGDVREVFIQDYVLWITKESEGMQKLDREVRDIFWRYLPFPQEVKDMLKNRGYVYNELYKKDQNRAMSDGY